MAGHKYPTEKKWCLRHEEWEEVPTTFELLNTIKALQERIEKLEEKE